MKIALAKSLNWALVVAGALTACAQKPTAAPQSAALEGAHRLERRASTAYSKGDLAGAYKDYQTAAAVYTSLALDAPLSTTQLNIAKIEAESGRVTEGLALTELVLGRANLDAATRLMAHGRAAALSLAAQKTSDAQKHLDAADKLCNAAPAPAPAPAGASCGAASALAVLQVETLMLGGHLDAARRASEVALQAAKTNADKANALRARASMGLASIGHAPQALADAEQALALDQAMGASARVIADLSLLAQLHSRAGHAVKARDYTALEKAAKAAREQLRLK